MLILIYLFNYETILSEVAPHAWTYLQLPLPHGGAGNVYLFVLSNWKVNIAENPIAVMGL
jgi:hypothetical protein